MTSSMLDPAPRSTAHGEHVGSVDCSHADTSSAEPGLAGDGAAWAALTDAPDEGLTPDGAAAASALARVPPEGTGYVSRQVGASELSSLLVAATVAPPVGELGARVSAALTAVESAAHPLVRDWLIRASDRAQWAAGREMVSRDAGPPCDAPWAAEKGRVVHTPLGRVPELVAVKANLRLKEAKTWSASEGTRLERALFDRWTAMPETREEFHGFVSQHQVADMYPPHWQVRAARVAHPECPDAVTYPDAWCRDFLDEWVVVNCKCNWKPTAEVAPIYTIQLQAEMWITRAVLGVLPTGQGWTAKYGWRAPPEQRPVDVFRVEPAPRFQAALAAFAHVANQWVSETADEWIATKKKNRGDAA
jgi:hypothetical protein